MVDSKEQFVRKMSDIRTRSLVESENIAADQVGCAGARRRPLPAGDSGGGEAGGDWRSRGRRGAPRRAGARAPRC